MRGDPRLMVKVVALTGLTGAAIMSLFLYVILPIVAHRLTTPQIAWLREIFNAHPSILSLTLLVAAALLGLPVFLVALWAARLGPWRR
jgi:NADH:ubiquinone oxidoreductase subunit 4 (subunit M)